MPMTARTDLTNQVRIRRVEPFHIQWTIARQEVSWEPHDLRQMNGRNYQIKTSYKFSKTNEITIKAVIEYRKGQNDNCDWLSEIWQN